MTVDEFQELLEGYDKRHEGKMKIEAWKVANLINVHLPKGKKIRPEQLLKKQKKVTGTPRATEEETDKALGLVRPDKQSLRQRIKKKIERDTGKTWPLK